MRRVRRREDQVNEACCPIAVLFVTSERLRDQSRRTRPGAGPCRRSAGLAGATPEPFRWSGVAGSLRAIGRRGMTARIFIAIRARGAVGDPVTVTISMNDKATLDNKTDRSRDSQMKFSADYLAEMFGWRTKGQADGKRQLADLDEGGGQDRPDGGGQVFRRGGRGRRAAERQSADQRLAGSSR